MLQHFRVKTSLSKRFPKKVTLIKCNKNHTDVSPCILTLNGPEKNPHNSFITKEFFKGRLWLSVRSTIVTTVDRLQIIAT